MPLSKRQGNDTYQTLFFQGVVCDVPRYDRKEEKLEFLARVRRRPPLKFVAKGSQGIAAKSVLVIGTMIQLRAVPEPAITVIGGEVFTVLEWKVIAFSVLSNRLRKVDLSLFADQRILDGLMPDLDSMGCESPIPKAKPAKGDKPE